MEIQDFPGIILEANVVSSPGVDLDGLFSFKLDGLPAKTAQEIMALPNGLGVRPGSGTVVIFAR